MDAAKEAWSRAFEVERAYGDGAEGFALRQIAAARAAGDDTASSLWDCVAATLRDLHQIGKPPSAPYRAQIGAPIDHSLS